MFAVLPTLNFLSLHCHDVSQRRSGRDIICHSEAGVVTHVRVPVILRPTLRSLSFVTKPDRRV
jgi:hypothetical protein